MGLYAYMWLFPMCGGLLKKYWEKHFNVDVANYDYDFIIVASKLV